MKKIDFAAYIPEDGPYIYDAIGNLVADEDEGVKISWTPYGKIREVKTNNDSVTVKFRYDGTGNRIEKRVEKYDTTLITRYVRDASGNVMTIYNDTTVSEQPIYGSARLGIYKGAVHDGHQTLGRRSYELSNHLGNVLAVITDNIGMNTEDTVWASVESSGDYYAFGMGMPGRSYSGGSYRYGFNGKEKDDKGELGETHYDYGFRIYNPRVSRFLSVDPLTKNFSMLTPYQYASNSPIEKIDFEGLEGISYTAKDRKKANDVLSQPLMLKVDEARPEEETVAGRFKLFFTTIQPLERRYYMDDAAHADHKYGLAGSLTEGGEEYYEVNSKGEINLNDNKFNPQQANIIRIGAAIRLMRSSRLMLNPVKIVHNTGMIKNSNLKNVFTEYFRQGSSIGNGGSAASLEYEATTGNLMSKSGHLQKVVSTRGILFNILKTESLTGFERRMVIKEINNIQNALKTAFGKDSKYPLNESAKNAINALEKQNVDF